MLLLKNTTFLLNAPLEQFDILNLDFYLSLFPEFFLIMLVLTLIMVAVIPENDKKYSLLISFLNVAIVFYSFLIIYLLSLYCIPHLLPSNLTFLLDYHTYSLRGIFIKIKTLAFLCVLHCLTIIKHCDFVIAQVKALNNAFPHYNTVGVRQGSLQVPTFNLSKFMAANRHLSAHDKFLLLRAELKRGGVTLEHYRDMKAAYCATKPKF